MLCVINQVVAWRPALQGQACMSSAWVYTLQHKKGPHIIVGFIYGIIWAMVLLVYRMMGDWVYDIVSIMVGCVWSPVYGMVYIYNLWYTWWVYHNGMVGVWWCLYDMGVWHGVCKAYTYGMGTMVSVWYGCMVAVRYVCMVGTCGGLYMTSYYTPTILYTYTTPYTTPYTHYANDALCVPPTLYTHHTTHPPYRGIHPPYHACTVPYTHHAFHTPTQPYHTPIIPDHYKSHSYNRGVCFFMLVSMFYLNLVQCYALCRSYW